MAYRFKLSQSQATVQALSVVNDLLLTKDEEQLQFLLQLVADYIKFFLMLLRRLN